MLKKEKSVADPVDLNQNKNYIIERSQTFQPPLLAINSSPEQIPTEALKNTSKLRDSDVKGFSGSKDYKYDISGNKSNK